MGKAKKFDQNKPMMALLSPIAIIEVSKVLTFGAKKYDAHNWRGGFDWSRPLAAALRHIFQFLAGEDLDQETKLPHLSHAMCEIMFALEFQMTHNGKDDRFTYNSEIFKNLMNMEFLKEQSCPQVEEVGDMPESIPKTSPGKTTAVNQPLQNSASIAG